MGIIIGKFKKKRSTYDILEKLEQEIVSIEEFGRSTEQSRKKIIGRFVLLAITVYVILAFALYVYYQRITTNQRLICIVPLIAFPLIIWVIKRFLTWYYSRKIRKNEKKLVSLKDEKKKILDNVMETETYKVAKKILDKFGNEPIKKPFTMTASESTPVANKSNAIVSSNLRLNQTGLRQRNIAFHSALKSRASIGGPIGASQTPFQNRQLVTPILANRSVSALTSMIPNSATIPGTPLPLPRSILPRDRSVLDKMVDYLVGDGPSNRYALICKQCNSHNGMSLKEEFEYLSFRCCYCSAFNPARKKRPSGPKFQSDSSPKALPAPSSDSEKNSGSDSDAESTKPVIGDFSDIDTLSDHEKIETELKVTELAEKGEVMRENGDGASPMDISDTVEVVDTFPDEKGKEKEPDTESPDALTE